MLKYVLDEVYFNSILACDDLDYIMETKVFLHCCNICDHYQRHDRSSGMKVNAYLQLFRQGFILCA